MRKSAIGIHFLRFFLQTKMADMNWWRNIFSKPLWTLIALFLFPPISFEAVCLDEDKYRETMIAMRSLSFNHTTENMKSELSGTRYKDLHHDYNRIDNEKGKHRWKSRFLEEDDFATYFGFDGLNDFLGGTSLLLPDVFMEELPFPFASTASIRTYNFECFDIQISNIMDKIKDMSPISTYILVLDDLEVTCKFDWTYSKGKFVDDDGKATIYTKKGKIALIVEIETEPFRTNMNSDGTEMYPTTAKTKTCLADIKVTNMDFSGGLRAGLVNAIEKSLRENVSKQVEDMVCITLEESMTRGLTNILNTTIGSMEPYFNVDLDDIDPLSGQNELTFPNYIQLLDFQGEFFSKISESINSMLGIMVEDSEGPNRRTTGMDLGINVLIRENLLDKNRVLQIPPAILSQIGFGQENLAGTSMFEVYTEFLSADISGIDTFLVFDNLKAMSGQTIQNNMRLQFLEAQLEVKVHIIPTVPKSPGEFHLLVPETTENFRIKAGIKDINALVSFLMAFDLENVGNLEFGNILDATQIFPCLHSVTRTSELAQLEFFIGDLDPPTFTGIISPGIDRLTTSFAQELKKLYGDAFHSAIPNFMGTSMRQLINSSIDKLVRKCPTYSDTENSNRVSYLDFRDLLMDANVAKKVGATGDSPYGTLASKVMGKINEFISEPSNNGSPNINEVIIDPFTSSQSGTHGTFFIGGEEIDVFTTSMDIIDINSLHVILRETRIQNLNSIGFPLKVLEPASSHPHILENEVIVGAGIDPLIIATKLVLSIDGKDVTQQNEVNISLDLKNFGFWASIMAKVNERSFMEFPLKDIGNLNCWFSTIAVPDVGVSDLGIPSWNTEELTASILDFKINADDINLSIDCISCHTAGVKELPKILSILERTGVMKLLTNSIIQSLVRTLTGDFAQVELFRLLFDSRKRCPHHPIYEEFYTMSDFDNTRINALLNEFTETIIFSGLIFIQVSAIIFALSLTQPDNATTSDPLSEQNRLPSKSPNTALLDFTNLSSSTIGNLVRFSLDTINKQLSHVGNAASGEDIGINAKLRSLLLDNEGSYTIPIKNTAASLGNIILEEVRLMGLDTFSSFDGLNPIAPQTLGSHLHLKTLEIQFNFGVVDVSLSETTSESREQHFFDSNTQERVKVVLKLDNIDMSMALLLALDESIFESSQLGIVLSSERLIQCALLGIDRVDITQLLVSVGKIHHIEVEGFIDDEIENKMLVSSKALFHSYESDLKTFSQLQFDTTIRKLFNNFTASHIAEVPDSACVLNRDLNNSKNIDFRDLLLDSTSSKVAGGTGKMPYGDIAPKAFDLATEFLSAEDENGSPKLNNVVRSFTQSISGIPGTINIPIGDGCISNKFDIGSIQVSIIDVKFENLDSIGYPLQLLQPKPNHPHILTNDVAMGTGIHPVRIATTLVLSIDEDDVTQQNELLVIINIKNAEVISSIRAKVNERSFMEFPLKDVENIDCWLSTIGILDEHDSILSIQRNQESSAFISDFKINADDINLSIDCISCHTAGVKELPKILSILERTGVMKLLTNSIIQSLVRTLTGDFAQVELFRLLFDSRKRCPHHPIYEEFYTMSDFDNTRINALLNEFTETIIFSGLIFIQVSAIIFALSLTQPDNATTSDPLSEQNRLPSKSPNTALLDFTNLSSSTIGNLVRFSLDTINKQLSHVGNAASGEDIGINAKLRSLLLDNEGSYTIPIKNTAASLGNIILEEVRLMGLDTFSSFDGLNPIAPQTLGSHLHLKTLEIQFNFMILSNNVTNKKKEHVSLALEFAGIDIDLAMFLIVDEMKLKNIQLSSVLNSETLLQCARSAISKIEVTQLSVSVGQMNGMRVDGFISKELKDLVALSSNVLFDAYKSQLAPVIKMFFDTKLRDMLNDNIYEILTKPSAKSCIGFTRKEQHSYIDFRDLLLAHGDAIDLGGSGELPYGNIASIAFQFVADNMFGPDEFGSPKLNRALIEPWTRAQSNITGTLFFPGEFFGQTVFLNTSTSIDDTIVFQVHDVKLENLDSMGYPLTLLQPRSDPFILDNQANMGVSPKKLRVSARILLSIQGDSSNVYNEVILSLELGNSFFYIPVLAKIDEELLLSLPIKHATNLHCWLSCIPAPHLNEFGVRSNDEDEMTASILDVVTFVEDLHLSLNCISCSGESFVKFAKLLESPQGKSRSTAIGQKVLDSIRHILMNRMAQDKIDRLLNKAHESCPRFPNFIGNSINSPQYLPFEEPILATRALEITIGLTGFLFAFDFCIKAIRYCLQRMARKKHKNWVSKLTCREIIQLHSKQEYEDTKVKSLGHLTRSMFLDDQIPFVVRILIPIVIICNIGLFVSGHISLGATIRADVLIGGQEIIIQDFFKFSIAQSISGMWKGGLKAFAVIIFICSVLWPYTKQLALLILWFIPPTKVSAMKRGSIFLKLDELGKWSMTDIYVVMITLIVFRLILKSPHSDAILPSDLYGIDMMIVPLWGLYANLIAQFLSQITSHFIIHYHREIVKAGFKGFEKEQVKTCGKNLEIEADNGVDATNDDDASLDAKQDREEERESLCNHYFSTSSQTNEKKLKVPTKVNYFVAAFGCTTLLLLALGCILPSFRIELFGLLGLLIDKGNEEEGLVQHHSIFTMAGVIIDEAKYLSGFSHLIGLGILTLLLVSTTLIVPCIQAMTVLFLWFAPMTKRKSHQIVLFIEILQAWQYVEVYVIASFLGMWQMGQLSESMVRAFCKPLGTFFASMAHYDVLSEKHARCFYADASLEGGAYVLVVAALMLSGLTNFVMGAEIQRSQEQNAVSNAKIFAERNKVKQQYPEESNISKWYINAPENLSKQIKLIPFQFTDSFYWLLGGSKQEDVSRKTKLSKTKDEIYDFSSTSSSLPSSSLPTQTKDDIHDFSSTLSSMPSSSLPTQIRTFKYSRDPEQMTELERELERDRAEVDSVISWDW